MPISEERVKMRLEIRREQVEAKDVLMCKLRDKIKNGYVPTKPEEFAGVLRLVSEYEKLVGGMEECQEILGKLSEEKPMTMEKFGVECNNEHNPTAPHMEKKASGEVQCRHCGKKFASINVDDGAELKDSVSTSPKKPTKGDMERMFNM